MDQQAQYSRRNYLLFFHGIKEEKAQDTDGIIINTVKEEMDIEIFGRIVLEILKQRTKKDQ